MLEHWYAALSSDYGVVIRCSDRERTRQRLYAARKEAQDPDLDDLSICFSPTNSSDLWIVKRKRHAPR